MSNINQKNDVQMLTMLQVKALLEKHNTKMFSKGTIAKQSTYKLTQNGNLVFVGNFSNCIKFLQGVVTFKPEAKDTMLFISNEIA